MRSRIIPADQSTAPVRRDYSDGKDLYWERPNGAKGLRSLRTESLPLYGTKELSGLPEGWTVMVCKGEKACEALKKTSASRGNK